jgi:hypothetical protein
MSFKRIIFTRKFLLGLNLISIFIALLAFGVTIKYSQKYTENKLSKDNLEIADNEQKESFEIIKQNESNSYAISKDQLSEIIQQDDSVKNNQKDNTIKKKSQPQDDKKKKTAKQDNIKKNPQDEKSQKMQKDQNKKTPIEKSQSKEIIDNSKFAVQIGAFQAKIGSEKIAQNQSYAQCEKLKKGKDLNGKKCTSLSVKKDNQIIVKSLIKGFETRQDAATFCDKLMTKSIGCFVVEFGVQKL